jgi:hypothetical protein
MSILLIAAVTACNNYDLLDSLERPGSKESFSDRLFVFVTSQMTAGDMFALNAGGCSGTGIGKADCVCQALAIQNGLRRSSTSKVLAWLSGSSVPMNCRLASAMGLAGCAPTGTQVWYNTNYEPVFQGIETTTTGLLEPTSPVLLNAIRYTEKRFALPTEPDNVWTGTNPGGVVSGNNCNDWQFGLTGISGRTGQSDGIGPVWTNSADPMCDQFKRIYCIAVP